MDKGGPADELAKQAIYWESAFSKRQITLRSTISKPWAQTIFDGFSAYLKMQYGAHVAYLKLPKQINAVIAIESRFGSQYEIHADSLVTKFSTLQLRRYEIFMRYLHFTGMALPTQSQLRDASDRRRINDMVNRASTSTLGPILKEFFDEFKALRSLQTQRLAIRAAFALTQLVGQRPFNQKYVIQLLKATPGQRNSLSRFVSFLKKNGYDVSLPGQRKPRRRVVAKTTDMLNELLKLSTESGTLPDLKAAAAGLLTSTSGLPLEHLLQLRRQAVTSLANGHLGIELGGRIQPMIEPLLGAMTRYLTVRDSQAQETDGYLFVGRPTFRPATSESIRVQLAKREISLSQLSAKARLSIAQAAGSTVKP